MTQAMIRTQISRSRLGTVSGVLLVAFLSSEALLAQAAHPITGRRIASTMGIGGADWLVRNERESEEQPEIALNAIGIRKGMAVADVGAGVGYFTTRLAKRVGPTGRVFATDIQPEMLARLQDRLDSEGIKNVETLLGTQVDPRLPEGQLDVILMVDVYHELAQPQRMLHQLRKALKPDGRLVLIEYRKEDPTIPIRPEHKMSVAEIKAELEAEGFRMVEVLPDLPRQHICVFRKQLVM
jgi:ubiquinone/menaquinone biosynthesis C-methylase UbiE